MDDLAKLGIEIDATSVPKAADALDTLTKQGGKAETAVNKLVAETKRLAREQAAAAISAAKVAKAQDLAGIAAAKLATEQQKGAIAVAMAQAKYDAMTAASAAKAAKAQNDDIRAKARATAQAERLLGAVDPLFAAQTRYNQALAQANALHASGNLSQEQYAKVSEGLASTLRTNEMIFKRGAAGAKLQANEVLNLSRQFADIGVTAAMGMSPLMILIQQGPQIADVFATAATRGLGFKDVLRQIAAGTWAVVAPFAPLIAGVVAATAVLGGGLALATRRLNKDNEKLAESLGLAEKQLEKVKDKSITMGDVFGGTMDYIGKKMYDAIGGDKIKKAIGDGLDAITRFAYKSAEVIVGSFGGAFGALKVLFVQLPYIVGDAVFSAANNVIAGTQKMINGSIKLLNGLISDVNSIGNSLGLANTIAQISEVEFKKLDNAFEGMGAAAGKAIGKGASDGYSNAVKGLGAVASGIEDAIIARATKRIKKEAGDAEKGSKDPVARTKAAAKTAEEKEYDRVISASASYARQLEKETVSIGLNVYERKKAESQLQLEALAKVRNTATSVEQLKIVDDLTDKIIKQTAAYVEKAKAQQLIDLNKPLVQENANLTLQGQLIMASARARDVATASLKAEQTLMNEHISITDANAQAYIKLAVANAQLNDTLKQRQELLAMSNAGVNESQELLLEFQLINATNAERTVALAIYKTQQELIAKNISLQSAEAIAIVATAKANALAQTQLEKGLGSTEEALRKVAFASNDVSASINSSAKGLADSFGNVGKTLGDLVGTYAELIAKQDEFNLRLEQVRKTNGESSEEFISLSKQKARAEVKSTADMLGAAKTLFKEKSAGFKVLESAEKAYRLFEFAMSAKSILVKAAETAAKLPAYLAETTAAAAAGAAKMFASLGPLGFPAVAAMGLTLAAFGFAAARSGSTPNLPTSESRQTAQAAGSTLGGGTSASESLANALSIAEKYQNKSLEFANASVNFLKSINNSIGSLADAVAKALVTTGALSTDKLNLGVSGNAPTLANLGFGSKTTTTLNDQGFQFGNQSIADVMAGGLQGSTYQELLTNKKKSAFGITYSDKTKASTVSNSLEGDLAKQFTDVIKSLRSSVFAVATDLGLQGAQNVIDSFQINLGKLSFKDMSGEEIQKALNAIFSKLGDDLANTVGKGLVDKFAKIGEGALETLVRLATGSKLFDQQVSLLGKTFGLTGIAAIEAKQGIIDLVGGLDSFQELTNSYAENFLTDAERLVPVQKAVALEMERLGLQSVTTKDQFKLVMSAIDLTTESGAKLFANMLKVAPAFAEVADAVEKATNVAIENAKKLVETTKDLLDKASKAVVDAYNYQVSLITKRTADAKTAMLEAERIVLESYTRQVTFAKDFAANAKAAMQKAEEFLIDSYNNQVSIIQAGVAKAKSAVEASQDALIDVYGKKTSVLQKLISDGEKRSEDAKNDLISLYSKEANAIKSVSTRWKEFSKSLRDFKGNLTTGPLAGLSPEDNYKALKTAFEDTYAKAQSGDQVAIAALSSVSENFLNASRDYYASSAFYVNDLEKVKVAVDNVAEYSDTQVSVADLQLETLNNLLDSADGTIDQLVKLGGITLSLNDGLYANSVGILSVDQSIQAVKDAIENARLVSTQTEDAKQQLAALNTLTDGIDGVVDGIVNLGDKQLILKDGLFSVETSVVSLESAIAAFKADSANYTQVKAQSDAQISAINHLMDGLDGVIDGLVTLSDKQLILQDGIFTLNTSYGKYSEAELATMRLQLDMLDGVADGIFRLGDLQIPLADGIFAANSSLFEIYKAVSDTANRTAEYNQAEKQSSNLIAILNLQLDAFDGVVDGVVKFSESQLVLKDGIFALDTSLGKYGEAEMAAMRLQLDALDGVIDGVLRIGDKQIPLSDGIFAVNSSLFEVVKAVQDASARTVEYNQFKAQADEQIKALNLQLDAIDGVIDGLVKLGDITLSLKDGFFVVETAVLSVESAIANFAAAMKDYTDAVKALQIVQPPVNNNVTNNTTNNAITNIVNNVTNNLPPTAVAPVTPVTQTAPAPTPNVIADTIGKANDNGINWQTYLENNSDVRNAFATASGRTLADLQSQGVDNELEFAEWHYNRYGKNEGRKPYAHGGIIDRPMTLGESGIGGEAGPEGILPLSKVGGKLGVSASMGDAEMKQTLKEIAVLLQKANAQRGAVGVKTVEMLEEQLSSFDELKREVARS